MRWPSFLPRRLSADIVLRIVADVIIVNVSFIAAFTVRFVTFFILWKEDAVPAQIYSSILQGSLLGYKACAIPVTLICIAIFTLSGFYTFARSYRLGYKALNVIQGVTVAYTIVGFFVLVFPLIRPLPKTVVVESWLVTLVLMESARMWWYLWRGLTLAYRKPSLTRFLPVEEVLLIGGAGYIGSILARKLLSKGYRVTVLDLLLFGDRSINNLLGLRNFRLIKGDFRDIDCVVGAMQNMDAVVHLGALVGDPACAVDERLTLQVNVAATQMIADVAKGFQVHRFIFASTCSVYGASDELLSEKSGLNPVSLYARSKIACEQILLGMANDQFAPTVLRFATIFGMSPRPRFDLVVNFLTARALIQRSITIDGGDQWRPFIHVADAAEAIIRTLEAPVRSVRHEVFNVGSDKENYQIAQIGEIVHRHVPGLELIQSDKHPDKRNYRVSFKKFQEVVRFIPTLSVDAGVTEILKALDDGTIGNYLSPEYNNYKMLSEQGQAVRLLRDDHMESIRLPSSDEERGNDLQADQKTGKYPLRGLLQKPKILVIDDDDLHLALMGNLLQRENCSVLVAATGKEGIRLYQQSSPHLVLLDISLPDMDGLDVLRTIRTYDVAAKVIVVTGYLTHEVAHQAILGGALDYVRKPFNPESLLDQIRLAIEGKGTEQDVAAHA